MRLLPADPSHAHRRPLHPWVWTDGVHRQGRVSLLPPRKQGELMTARRFNTQPTVSPALTQGDDQPRPACLGQPHAFDMLTDYGANSTTKHALREAAALCGSCALRVGCWAENWNEPWMLAMRGQPVPRHHKGRAA